MGTFSVRGPMPVPEAFGPSTFPGCQLWLDASDGTTLHTGTGISQWDDKSGNGFNVSQATGASQPTLAAASLNGLDTLAFSGGQGLLRISATLLRAVSSWTIIVVGKNTNTTVDAVGHLFLQVDQSNGDGVTRASLAAGLATSLAIGIRSRRLSGFASQSLEATPAFGNGYGCFSGVVDFSTTTGEVWQGSTLAATTSSYLDAGNTDNAGGGVSIGCDTSGPGSQPITGNIGQVIVYSPKLSSSDLSTAQAALQSKWGV